MSSLLKQNLRSEEDTTTLPQTRRSDRKFFKRQPSQVSHSNQSRRSINKSNHRRESSESHKMSYIRMPLQLLPTMTQMQQSVPHSYNYQSSRLSHLGKKMVINGGISCVGALQKRVENLENEINLKNQELQLIQEEKQKIKTEFEELDKKYRVLEQSHKTNLQTTQSLRQDLRKSNIQCKKRDQQKQLLNKKILFLQNVQFTSDTKNIQTLRQVHLQSELQSFKTKLKESKSEVESLLQLHIQQLREQLFTSKRLVESLQINNDCLQKKIDSTNYLVSQEDNYNALKSKYRKFLTEYKELKKLHESAVKENKILKTQIKKEMKEEQSLELSLYSIMN